MRGTKDLLEFWEDQVRRSHSSSNYFFRKSPSHYHMMLLVMNSFKQGEKLSVEELKTKLFKTSRPKSALIINEACENNFFYLEKTSTDQRKKNIKPTDTFVKEFDEYMKKLKMLQKKTNFPTKAITQYFQKYIRYGSNFFFVRGVEKHPVGSL